MQEFNWIAWIKNKTLTVPSDWVGIGDDAAIFPGSAFRNRCVVATDAIVEGIDFDEKVPLRQAGRKALAINLSDMAAMGAKPKAFLLTLGVPLRWNGNRLRQFLAGMLNLAQEYQLPCIGGDMSAAKDFFCNVTILGEEPQSGSVLRSGAHSGDFVLVTGTLGGSILRKHYAFQPRVSEAEWLVQNFKPSAMLDISDGLVQDLGHLLQASRKGARLNLDQVPISVDAKRQYPKVERALQGALSDGEDFELLFTLAPSLIMKLQKRWQARFPKVRLSVIGKVESQKSIRYFNCGVFLPHFKARAGYQHLK